MLNLKSGKHFTDAPTMTRGGFLRGGIASIIAAKSAPYIALGAASLAGSANASVARGMMRNTGAQLSCVFNADKPKPYDAEIEWIESNGSAWIDTGVPLASPFEIDFDFLLPILGNGFWIGEFYSNKRFYILYQFVGFGFGYGTSNTSGSVKTVANTKYHAHSVLKNGEQYITIDGSYSYHTYVNEDVNNGNNLFVGKFMNMGNPKIRIYNGMKVWQGGQLKGDFVTCLKDGKGELYNKVGNGYFCERHGDFLIPT